MDTVDLVQGKPLDFFAQSRGEVLPILISIKAHDKIEEVKLTSHFEGFSYKIEGKASQQIQAEILLFFEHYFSQKAAPLPLFLWKGITPFTQAVLQKVAQIPIGETRTYAEIARQLEIPSAARAIGGALGRNPFPFFIPCHRVVASNGIGGFSCGLRIKRSLLNFENKRHAIK